MTNNIASNSVEGSNTILIEESALAGKYMTFRLDHEEYGLEILKVKEIIGLMDITRVPKMQNFVKGVINLRGKVIPVIDLRLKFQMSETEPSEQTVIIVVQIENGEQTITMGVIVDEVLEVLDIQGDQIEPPPAFTTDDRTHEFIIGVGKVETRVVFLLDIEKILSDSELKEIKSHNATQEA